MKFVGLLLISGIAVASGFFAHAPFRENVRSFLAGDATKDRITAYRTGRDLLLSQWSVAPNAKVPAWGDNSAIDAAGLEGEVWQARGFVDIEDDNKEIRLPWIAVFNRGTGELLLAAAGPQAAPRLDALIKAGVHFPPTIKEWPQWVKRNPRSPLLTFVPKSARNQFAQIQPQTTSAEGSRSMKKKSRSSASSDAVRASFGWEPSTTLIDH